MMYSSTMKLPASILFGLMMLMPSLAPAQATDVPDGGGKVIEVNRIWDKAKHNAFTDLVRFQNKWFCVFREGSGHVSEERGHHCVGWTLIKKS